MPMFDLEKKPLDFSFNFHRVFQEIQRDWIGFKREWPEGYTKDFYLTDVMNESDYSPQPSFEDVRDKKLRTEVNRWKAFKACLRRNPEFYNTKLMDCVKLTPKVIPDSRITKGKHRKVGFRLVIRVKRLENHVQNLQATIDSWKYGL